MIAKTGIVTTNTQAACIFTINAIIIAPKTTKGERSNKRKNKFQPV